MAINRAEAQETFFCYQQLLGQQRAKSLVTRAIAADRLPHAFLFRGPEGVGKVLFARGLAAALNCRGGVRGQACGQCPSCRKLRGGNHPDFLHIRPDKGAIKIEQVREMCRALSFPPYESPLRVVVLEDVHAMQAAAANSLLKTLEEPPAGNLLILTAESAREVLPTIVSRCQNLPFFPLTDAQTVQLVQASEPQMDGDTACLLARLAEGSPGRALLFYQQEMMALLQKILAALTETPRRENPLAVQLLLLAEEMAAQKEHLPALFGLLRVWLGEMLCGRQELGFVQKSWNSQQLFGKLQAIDRAEQQLARNCNRSLVCEVLLFHLQDQQAAQAGPRPSIAPVAGATH